MSRNPRVLLWDIEKAARSIAAFTAGLDGKGYSESELIHSAVERKFEIIGEALGQLSKQAPELVGRIDGYREIIAFRNVLIHDALQSRTIASGA